MGARRERVRLLTSWRARALGLLGTDEQAGAVLLSPCGSIHTFGMRYALDVAFIARDGLVLRVERRVFPGRMLSCARGAHVLERPARDGPWLRVGSWVSFGLAVQEGRSA